MATLPYWFVTRPHRKLIRVPKSLSAFAGVASGQPWNRNRDAQISYESRLEDLDLKRPGEHTERARGRGGSGGRTHAQLLYALGLFFIHRESESAEEEVHLTLAGQALVDQEDALPVLQKQVLAFQYPSAYSVSNNVNVDRRFRLRPFVLLLRLLCRPELGGYLTDGEIAACVIGYATKHTASEADRVTKRILAFRARGLASLDADFCERFSTRTRKSASALISGPLGDIANTFAQWLRYTGFATAAAGVDYGADDVRTVTAINPVLATEIENAIEQWVSKPLVTMYEPDGATPYELVRSTEAFQRTYGVKAGGTKDQRQISAVRRASAEDRTLGLVSSALSHLYATEIVERATAQVVDAVVTHTGLDPVSVEKAVERLIATPQHGLTQFLDRYQQMAFSGTEEAIAFEKATATILREVFKLDARHIGQGGRVPDVEIFTSEWVGIVDTKAYAAYSLESDHQLRMRTSYIPAYADSARGVPLRFFLYIAGGFAPSFTPNLRKISSDKGVPGAGIGIQPWLDLILGYPGSGMTPADLLDLWTMDREITASDVAEAIGDRP